MRLRPLLLLCLAIWLPVTLAAGEDASPPIILSSGQAADWKAHGCRLVPASGEDPARIVFAADGWSALLTDRVLDRRLRGRLALRLRCRWLEGGHGQGRMRLVALDSRAQEVPVSAVVTPIADGGGWQDLLVSAPIGSEAPGGIRAAITATGGGSLELASCRLELHGVDLTEAAGAGIELPWLTVPGGPAGRQDRGPERAEAAQAADGDVLAFDWPGWEGLPVHPIPTTTCNKTPPGAVSASFRLAWTSGRLAVRFAARDHRLNFADEKRYLRDCFEFFLVPAAGLAKEQYTVTRSVDGTTSANAEAVTRIVDGGWEAILAIPLATEQRRVRPFNGLAASCNAAYQDANEVGQEHWLSFSRKDQANASWRDTSLYVPLVFTAEAPTPYQPIWLRDRAVYDVEPACHGRINLVRWSGDPSEVTTWDKHPRDAVLAAAAEDGQGFLRARFHDQAEQRLGIVTTPFTVLPGETLEVEFDARCDADAPVGAIQRIIVLSRSSCGGGSRDSADPRSDRARMSLIFLLAFTQYLNPCCYMDLVMVGSTGFEPVKKTDSGAARKS